MRVLYSSLSPGCCDRIVGADLQQYQQQPELVDKEFKVCSLGLQGSMESLMASNDSKVVPLLLQCLSHPQRRRSTKWVCTAQPILESVGANLDPGQLSVCNNACWSVGRGIVCAESAGKHERGCQRIDGSSCQYHVPTSAAQELAPKCLVKPWSEPVKFHETLGQRFDYRSR